MMKKIIFLLIILLLTGCSANFNVEIKQNTVEQNIFIQANNYELDGTLLNTIAKNVYIDKQDTTVLGRFRLLNNKNDNPLNAFVSYNINDYDYDYSLYICYDNQNITYSNNILKIETSNYFNCFDKYSIIDDVNINVTTGYKVLENNADKVDGNTYTWNITKSNKKGIKLTLDTTVDEIQEEEKQKEKLNKNLIFIIIGTLVLSAFGTVFFVFIKSNKNNKI